MLYTVKSWFGKALNNLDWLIQEMDVTQWGIVATIFVVLGFLALKTKI